MDVLLIAMMMLMGVGDRRMKVRGAVCVFLVLFFGTGGVGRANVWEGRACVVPDTSVVRELPLPSVPSSLRTVPERAAFVMEHFWDAMDFRDTLCGRNRAFLEQNFVNFISLFPHATGEARSVAVKRLLQAAESDATAYALLAELSEQYLYDAASPMLNEEYFLPFLEAFAGTSVLDDARQDRCRYLLEVARKNRPGMLAADFAYFTREGKRQTLHRTPGECVLLVFYDPDCGHCRVVMSQLRNHDFLRQQVRDGRLTVLAVCTDADRKVWERTSADLPAEWIVGFDAGELQDKELYVLPELPTIYLLDGDKRVVFKEILPEALLSVLTARLGTEN